MLAPVAFNNISLNITISTGTTLNIGNNVFLNNGQTLTNNGTLTANGASSNFVWFLATAPMTYTGTGTVTAPMTNFAMQADMGLTINPSVSNIVVGAIRIFAGSITNSNKITIGNGGATTGIVQIGNTTTPTNAGSFDVAPTFNLGTGGQTISYLRTTTARTTGFEVNPTRILTSMTQATQPNQTPAKSLQRYWTLTETGDLTADLTFNYLQGDANGNETIYELFKVSGGVTTHYPHNGTTVVIDTSANTGFISGVSSFSDWTLGEPTSPTRVLVRSFAATRSRSGVALRWRSASEVGVAGYELYRGQVRLNRRLAAARGGASTASYRFQHYRYLREEGEERLYYFASHRMTNDCLVCIYPDGRSETVDEC